MKEGKAPPHGGARKGAGRKPGSGKGRSAVTFSGSMMPQELAKMRALQQGQPLGRFLVAKLGLSRALPTPPKDQP